MLLQTLSTSSSCKLYSFILQIVILRTVPIHLANCHLVNCTIPLATSIHSSCKLSSCKVYLILSFPALGRSIWSHCSWCGCRSEELLYQLGLISRGDLLMRWVRNLMSLVISPTCLLGFSFSNPICRYRSFEVLGRMPFLLLIQTWRQ